MKTEVGILLAFVFFACFQAWRDEYEKASKIVSGPTVQVTNQVTVPAPVIPAPIVNFPPQMAYLSSTIGFRTHRIGEHIEIDDVCNNLSQSVPAEQVACGPVALYIVDVTRNKLNQLSVSAAVQDKSYSRFKTFAAKVSPDLSFMTLGPKESKFTTAVSDELLDQSVDDAFKAGAKTILLASEYQWRDGMGRHISQQCVYWLPQPGMSMGPNKPWTLANCQRHNGLQSHVK